MKNLMTIIAFGLAALLSGCGGPAGVTSGAKPSVGDMVVFKSSPVVYNEGKVEKIDGNTYEMRVGNNIMRAGIDDVYPVPKAGSKTDVKVGDLVVVHSRESHWSAGEVKNVTPDVVEVEPISAAKINVAPDKILKVSPTAVADIKAAQDKKGFEEAGKRKRPIVPPGWKPKKGDRVAAQWSFGTWHVAIIKNVNANNVDLDWQNGWSDGSVALDKIVPYPTGGSLPATGSYVIVKPQSDTQEWKFATVSSVSGDEAEIKFADGKIQKVKSVDIIALV